MGDAAAERRGRHELPLGCAREFADGSMGPKVEAVCRFVEATGRRAAIGRLEDLASLIDGTAGTQIGADPLRPLAAQSVSSSRWSSA